ncbi:hypothetical protein C1H46_008462 [Malus baccata]|uniref:Uncharacterized protein n=1 Tax=Malus baccata TaxID=106549 RepID=A0A540N4F8_MALBA|nr:hypothetical protein C1H46_008462 [Malus baccata]
MESFNGSLKLIEDKIVKGNKYTGNITFIAYGKNLAKFCTMINECDIIFESF